jgi:hypothetical protein
MSRRIVLVPVDTPAGRDLGGCVLEWAGDG